MDILSVLYEYFFSYAGMGALGFILCIFVSMLLCFKYKLEPVKFLLLFIVSVVPVYLGAKLFGVFSLFFFKAKDILLFTSDDLKNAGIVFYGGLFAYLLYMLFILRFFDKKKRPRIFNCAALLIPLFHGFARIGCYFAHCCYGVVAQMEIFSLFYEHRIPVQLIEAVFELFLFLLLGSLYVRKNPNFSLARTYLSFYSLFRFLIEFLRGDAIRGFIGPLSFSQWISFGIIIFLLLTRKKKGVSVL